MINESIKRFSIILTSIKLLRVYANMCSINDIEQRLANSRLYPFCCCCCLFVKCFFLLLLLSKSLCSSFSSCTRLFVNVTFACATKSPKELRFHRFFLIFVVYAKFVPITKLPISECLSCSHARYFYVFPSHSFYLCVSCFIFVLLCECLYLFPSIPLFVGNEGTCNSNAYLVNKLNRVTYHARNSSLY